MAGVVLAGIIMGLAAAGLFGAAGAFLSQMESFNLDIIKKILDLFII